MHLADWQKAKVKEKEDALPDALKRDSLTDYREGFFFVTLNTRDSSPILSTVIGRLDVEDGNSGAPRCLYSSLGEKVMECWKRIPEFYPMVKVLGAEVMPEHFHGLLYIQGGGKVHLGQIIRGFMIGCTHAYWDRLGIEWRVAPGVITPDYRDIDHARSFCGPALFIRGYNDVEALTPEQVEIKKQYLRGQARKRLTNGRLHDRFKVHRNCNSRGWTDDALRQGLLADWFLAHDSKKLDIALQIINTRINRTPSFSNPSTSSPSAFNPSLSNPTTSTLSNPLPKPVLDFIGNKELLAAERKLPLICHRADAAFFEQQKESVLAEARKGAVIVSAFISPKEREILKILLSEQLPVIEIMDNGFSNRYKPVGTAFYACGENRLVQISPWNYVFQKDVKVTREMCMIMNQLSRVITKEKDDWWK